jgi:CheY-like chemotaxis protein
VVTIPQSPVPPADGEFTLLADLPLGVPSVQDRDGSSAHQQPCDVLGFAGVARRLADLVFASRRSTPLAIGVLGGWGCGKSTLMRFAEAEFSARKGAGAKVETVWFDAWVTEGTEVLEGMIKLVLDAIGPRVVRRALRNRRLVRGLRLATTLGLAWLPGGSRWIDAVWTTLSVDGKARNDLRAMLADAMREWRRRQAARGERLLVIFVDNLDRCSADRAVDVFEAIKVYLDEPGLVFVIGYDQLMVGTAVRLDKSLDVEPAAQYLEKIVQIEYRVPRPTDEQARRLVDTLVVSSGTGGLLGEAERTLIVERTDRNPRRVKRFLNNFVLGERLDPAARAFDATEHIKILLLRTYSPDFYELLLAPGERDAISEFLAYARFDEAVRSGATLPPEDVAATFDMFGLPSPTGSETSAAALDRLRNVIPEPMIQLATNGDFRSLVESLGDGMRQGLLDWVRGRREAFEFVPPEHLPARARVTVPPPVRGDLAGLTVLWINDVPEGNRNLVSNLRWRGVKVVEVRSRAEAEQELLQRHSQLARPFVTSGLPAAPGPTERQEFDLLISGIARDGNPDAGFFDVEILRSGRLHKGPVFFVTSRVTAECRQKAAELGALGIGTSIDPAVAYLERVAAELASAMGAICEAARVTHGRTAAPG